MVKFEALGGGVFFLPERMIVRVYTGDEGELRLVSLNGMSEVVNRPIKSFEVAATGKKIK